MSKPINFMRKLLFVLSIPFITLSSPAFSQPSPTGNYQPGFWQPEAKVNLNRTIKIELLNQTGYTLEYGKAEDHPRLLPSGEKRYIHFNSNTNKGSITSIPINHPKRIVFLRFYYHVINNLVKVKIVPTNTKDSYQGLALYIDEKGRIYTF